MDNREPTQREVYEFAYRCFRKGSTLNDADIFDWVDGHFRDYAAQPLGDGWRIYEITAEARQSFLMSRTRDITLSNKWLYTLIWRPELRHMAHRKWALWRSDRKRRTHREWH